MINTTRPKRTEKTSERPLELLVVVDNKFRIQSASQSFYHFFDETHKSAKGKTIDQVSVEEHSLQTLEERYQAELQNPDYVEGLGMELNEIELLGKKLWVTARQLLMEDMSPNLILLIFQEDKESEASANKLVMLDDKDAFDMQVILNEDLRVLSANQRYYEFFDTSDRTTEGRSLQKLGAHQWDIPRLNDLLQEVITDKQPFQGFEVDYDFPRIGRKSLRLKAQTLVKYDGEPDLVLLTMEDLTERKEIEREIEQLRSSRERYEVIFNSTYQFTGLLDRNGRLLEANRTALDFAGITMGDVLDKRVWETVWFREEDQKQLRQSVRRAAAGELVRHELSISGQDQQEVIIDFSLKPDFNKKGRVRWIIAEGRDITDKKQIEHNLERSEQLINSIYESASVGIDALTAVRDARGSIVDFIYQRTNYRSREIKNQVNVDFTGKSLLTMYPGVQQQGLLDEYIQVAETGETFHDVFYYGHEHLQLWVDLTVSKWDDGILFTYNDITQQKQAEEKVQKSADLIEAVFNASDAVLQHYGAVRNEQGEIEDFVYLKTNQKALEMAGMLPHTNLIGQRLLDVHPGVKATGVFDILVRVTNGGAPEEKLFYYNQEGIDKWFKGNYRQLGDGVVVTITDITKLKMAEQQLLTSERKFRTLVENTPDVICRLDTELHYTFINSAFETQTGLNPKQFLGLKPTDLGLGTVETQRFMQLLAEARDHKETRTYYGTVPTPKGNNSIFSLIAPELNEEQEVISLSVITRDVTELAEVEQQLRKRTEELEMMNRELSSFTYSISHDLRAPLRAMHGFTSMLTDRYQSQLDEEGKRLLGIVTTNVGRMSKLINDLLRFSHLGKKTMATQPLDLVPIIKESFDELNKAHGSRATLDVQPLPTVQGDRDMMRQLISNLLSNALKFSSREQHPQVKVGVESHGTMPVIFVSDNGVGFNQKYDSKLFEVFQRLHRDDDFEGTGVGLAIVQKIIHRHGGEVWAKGEEGQGAIVYFSLPQA